MKGAIALNFYKLYIDPSVMSYGLQIAVGVAVTLGAIGGVVFRKMKKGVKKTLNIEEKKEIEDDIVDLSE